MTFETYEQYKKTLLPKESWMQRNENNLIDISVFVIGLILGLGIGITYF